MTWEATSARPYLLIELHLHRRQVSIILIGVLWVVLIPLVAALRVAVFLCGPQPPHLMIGLGRYGSSPRHGN